MHVTSDDIKSLARLSGLEIPDGDLSEIAARMTSMLFALKQFEEETLNQMDLFEPIPPVYQSEESLREQFELGI